MCITWCFLIRSQLPRSRDGLLPLSALMPPCSEEFWEGKTRHGEGSCDTVCKYLSDHFPSVCWSCGSIAFRSRFNAFVQDWLMYQRNEGNAKSCRCLSFLPTLFLTLLSLWWSSCMCCPLSPASLCDIKLHYQSKSIVTGISNSTSFYNKFRNRNQWASSFIHVDIFPELNQKTVGRFCGTS